MSARPFDFDADVDTIVAKPVPFATVCVTLDGVRAASLGPHGRQVA